ncbi:olfactomedin-like protein 2A isoform X1 [Hemiscyllium ocellatum]|uniref:olfactomedin-like protein 2A isoform X1 n=1 Tax=Hemiscyllium ocellatum TaxID=170820 RepID=UPI0029676007|nr:olfactomedin-like protein 2A isoform X1 [Hemiscyllium ocellatum]
MTAGLMVFTLLLNPVLTTPSQNKAVSRRIEETDCNCAFKMPTPMETRWTGGKTWAGGFHLQEMASSGSKCKCYCGVDPCEYKNERGAAKAKVEVSDLTTIQSLAIDLQEIFDNEETKRLNSYSAKLNSQLRKLEKRLERNVPSVNALLRETFETIVQHRSIYQNFSTAMRDVRKEISKLNFLLRKQQPLPLDKGTKNVVRLTPSKSLPMNRSMSKVGSINHQLRPQSPASTKPRTRLHIPTSQPSVPPPETANGQTSDEYRNMIREDSCDGTPVMIRGPKTHSSSGRGEGVWMKDSVINQDRVYVANYFFGTTLIEFRNLEYFKLGRWSNTYKLPSSWMGTGHAVYNGSFYYNKAYTRNLIRFDLRLRAVASWTALDELGRGSGGDGTFRWKGYSEVDFTVDEGGLWVAYFSNDFGYLSEEVLVLSRLDPVDLTARKETTWRTPLRRASYRNYFLICGVLYAMGLRGQTEGTVSYAFDTHTGSESNPGLRIQSKYSYLTQIDYNPNDKLLYAWDNGFQVTYDVMFTY